MGAADQGLLFSIFHSSLMAAICTSAMYLVGKSKASGSAGS